MEFIEGDRVVRRGKGFVHSRCVGTHGGDSALDAAMREPCEIVCVANEAFPWEVRCERDNPRFPNLLLEAFYNLEGANAFALQNGVKILRVRGEDEISEEKCPKCKFDWCKLPAFEERLCSKHYLQRVRARGQGLVKRGRPKKEKEELVTNG
jgi:hypothetical protein